MLNPTRCVFPSALAVASVLLLLACGPTSPPPDCGPGTHPGWYCPPYPGAPPGMDGKQPQAQPSSAVLQ